MEIQTNERNKLLFSTPAPPPPPPPTPKKLLVLKFVFSVKTQISIPFPTCSLK